MAKSGKEKSPVQIAGDVLRHLRELAGLTQTELAQKVYSSQSTISGLERGIVRAKGTMIADIDRALSARDVLNVVWPVTMAGGYSPEFLANLESEAVKIHEFENRVVPGLLQTSEYARAVMQASRPLDGREAIDNDVSTRTDRQSIFTRNGLLMWFVIDEHILYRPYGGRDAMREQLLKLEDAAGQPGIIIQILESSATSHPGGEGPLRIMEFQDAPPVWYTDSWSSSGRVSDERDEVLAKMTSFDLIRAAALPKDRSVEFIKTVRVQRYE